MNCLMSDAPYAPWLMDALKLIRDFYEFAQPNVAVYVAVFAKSSDTNKKKSYKSYIFQRKFIGFLELLIRFERTTCSLRVSCSTG